MEIAEVIEKLTEKFGADALGVHEYAGQTRVTVAADVLYDVLEFLKTDADLAFDMLVDVHAVDYLYYRDMKDRFGVTYQVASTEHNRRLWVRAMVNDPEPTVKSAVPLWEAANWLEREVFDLMGITFKGHPDLRRIMMPESFGSHPLRKDYPLRGKGERHDFERLTREES